LFYHYIFETGGKVGLDRADAATKDLRRKAPACIFMQAKNPDYHPTLPSDHTSARTGVHLLLSHGIFVIVGSSDFENVKQRGCRSVVRLVLLWASTGMKDKSFPDTLGRIPSRRCRRMGRPSRS